MGGPRLFHRVDFAVVGASFREVLFPESVTCSLAASSKDGVLGELARLLARSMPETNADALRRVLVERERLASTGVGSGVAVPHGRLPGLSGMRVALAVHREGVHFEAIDGLPVQIFVAIVGPDTDPSAHLRLLARASRILRDEAVRARLLAAESDELLRQAFVEAERD